MKRALALLGTLLWVGVASAAQPTIAFQKYTLKNGLTVILSQDHRLPQVAVDVWYHVGGADHAPGRTGFAHLVEHMMTSGSEHVGRQPAEVLQAMGAHRWNASTSLDRTNYYEVVPTDELPAALWFESDRMGFLLESIDPKHFAIEQKVVSNERRLDIDSGPREAAHLRLMDLIFPAPHPYYAGSIGTLSDIKEATFAEVKHFIRRYYAPNDATIAIVGDFRPDVARALVKKYFGPLRRGPEIAPLDVAQPRLERELDQTLRDARAGSPALYLAWSGVRSFAPDEPAGDILGFVLGIGRSSRLYQALVARHPVASKVYAWNVTLELGGYFTVQVTAAPGHSASEVRAGVQRVLDRLKRDGITQQELTRAKRRIIASFLRSMQRLGGDGGKADLLSQFEMFTGDPGNLSRDLAAYRAVTAEQVRAFARKYLPDARRVVLDVEPTAKTASVR